MRIIKVGEIPKKEKEMTCGYCNTVFAYESTDVSVDRDGSYVKCPHCEKYLTV